MTSTRARNVRSPDPSASLSKPDARASALLGKQEIDIIGLAFQLGASRCIDSSVSFVRQPTVSAKEGEAGIELDHRELAPKGVRVVGEAGEAMHVEFQDLPL